MTPIDFTCPRCCKASNPEVDEREPDPEVTCPDCGFSMRVSEDAAITRQKMKWGTV
jgi:transcription elongation factor Elf1